MPPLSPAQRSRNYRARLRGENVPRGKPGRPRFQTTESPEEFLGRLLDLNPQRLRDLESAATSHRLTLAQFVENKRQQLVYGQQPAPEPEPHDPVVEELLDFRRRSEAE